jgi:hypothetical protein
MTASVSFLSPLVPVVSTDFGMSSIPAGRFLLYFRPTAITTPTAIKQFPF